MSTNDQPAARSNRTRAVSSAVAQRPNGCASFSSTSDLTIDWRSLRARHEIARTPVSPSPEEWAAAVYARLAQPFWHPATGDGQLSGADTA